VGASPLSIAEGEAYIQRARAGQSLADQAQDWSGDLRAFIAHFWSIVEPMTPFVSNWHIDAICEHLEAITRGELRRLIINIPPRHMKSLTVSAFWPAWCWTTKPHTRFLTASHDIELAQRDAVKSRAILLSPSFTERWPQVKLKGDVNRVTRYENTRTGYRIAVSVGGGGGTGEGGDVIIIDDPHKPLEALTDSGRNKVVEWHDGTIGFRFNDQKTGSEVVVMQRLHELDLAGHLLERGGFEHLCLPARYEPSHPFVWPDDPRGVKGDLLWPEHIPEAALADMEATMLSFRAAGQLQQRPAAMEGELIKREWWRFYSPDWDADDVEKVSSFPRFSMIVQSWDPALKAKDTNDPTAGQVWGIHGADRYLLRSTRARLTMNGLVTTVKQTHAWVAERWPHTPQYVLIENAAAGPEAIAALQREIPGVIKINARDGGDKELRASTGVVPLESHNVFVRGRLAPDTAMGYLADEPEMMLIEECCVFPNGEHDDQVDAFSQAMNWAARRGIVRKRAQLVRARGRMPKPGSLSGV
jgi:predicted phage terminase large subunit-like protein